MVYVVFTITNFLLLVELIYTYWQTDIHLTGSPADSTREDDQGPIPCHTGKDSWFPLSTNCPTDGYYSSSSGRKRFTNPRAEVSAPDRPAGYSPTAKRAVARRPLVRAIAEQRG